MATRSKRLTRAGDSAVVRGKATVWPKAYHCTWDDAAPIDGDTARALLELGLPVVCVLVSGPMGGLSKYSALCVHMGDDLDKLAEVCIDRWHRMLRPIYAATIT